MGDKILVVEDEADLAQVLEYNLQRAGFDVVTAARGSTALALVQKESPRLVLLDLMLPDISGTDVCRQLKNDVRTAHIPVVMLTAKGEEIDRVVGFEIGAEDYVVKPFSVRELILRLQAILRRNAVAAVVNDGMIEFGLLKIDTAAHRVWVDGAEIDTTTIEFKLLVTLWQRKNRVQSRAALLSSVWGISSDVNTRTVDTHVKRLREKLGKGGDYVETVRGVGYRFAAEP